MEHSTTPFRLKFKGSLKYPAVVEVWLFLNFRNKRSIRKQRRGFNCQLSLSSPEDKSNQGIWEPTNTPRFFSFFSGLAFEEGKAAAILRWISALKLIKAQPRPRSWHGSRPVRRRPTPRRKVSYEAGEGEETAHKSSTTCPLSLSKGKGGEKGNRNGPGTGDPARAAFKLRFYNLSQGAAANGTRARRPANQRRASSRRRPMAVRVLGAWAKQASLLGCSVWAGVGAGYLGCTWSVVLLRGLLCPAFALLCVSEFFFSFFAVVGALRLGGGSAGPLG